MIDSTILRILVVDDNQASAQTLGWMLELGGHTIRLALDGRSGVDIARAFQPHVILLDIGMPGLNGYEVCALMKKEPVLKDTVFIAQTGWGQQEHRQQSREAGFNYHLVKPVKIQQLEDIVASVIANRESSFTVS